MAVTKVARPSLDFTTTMPADDGSASIWATSAISADRSINTGCWRRHVPHAMTIRVAVDGGDGGTYVSGYRVGGRDPTADLIEPFFAREIAGSQFRFGQRANSASPEMRDKSYENLRRGKRIRVCSMTPVEFDVKPVAKSTQIVAGEMRSGQARKSAYIKRPGHLPRETGPHIRDR